jgi:hypothetical protein
VGITIVIKANGENMFEIIDLASIIAIFGSLAFIIYNIRLELKICA